MYPNTHLKKADRPLHTGRSRFALSMHISDAVAMPRGWIRWSSVLVAPLLLSAGCVAEINAPLASGHLNGTAASLLASTDSPTRRTAVIVHPKRRPLDGGDLERLDRHADGRFVGISISGGGSRAANFGAAVLLELDRLGWLSRADYLSSVSGGGFPAAIYCSAPDAEWNESRLRQQFGEDLLSVFLTGFTVQSPILLATDRDRGDLLFEILNRRFFTREGRTLTFADLRRDRPRLLVNCVNVANGTRFVFCNESFGQLGSDLASLPIGRAVAASAAHPALSSPLALRDHGATSREFVHLADGGIADNLGIRTLYETYLAHVMQSEPREVYPLGAVFIVVDARVHAENRIEAEPDLSLLRSLVVGLNVSAVSLVSGVSDATLAEIVTDASRDDDTVALVRGRFAALRNAGITRFTDRTGRDFTLLHISLAQLGDLDDAEARRLSGKASKIATNLRISGREQDLCWQAAGILVARRYERVLRDLETPNDAGATR